MQGYKATRRLSRALITWMWMAVAGAIQVCLHAYNMVNGKCNEKRTSRNHLGIITVS